eukprot:gene1049-201_t
MRVAVVGVLVSVVSAVRMDAGPQLTTRQKAFHFPLDKVLRTFFQTVDCRLETDDIVNLGPVSKRVVESLKNVHTIWDRDVGEVPSFHSVTVAAASVEQELNPGLQLDRYQGASAKQNGRRVSECALKASS